MFAVTFFFANFTGFDFWLMHRVISLKVNSIELQKMSKQTKHLFCLQSSNLDSWGWCVQKDFSVSKIINSGNDFSFSVNYGRNVVADDDPSGATFISLRYRHSKSVDYNFWTRSWIMLVINIIMLLTTKIFPLVSLVTEWHEKIIYIRLINSFSQKFGKN